MSDGRKNNGGNKNAGRKSKAVELKLLENGTDAIKEVYGSLEKYWVHIAIESKTSLQHLKILTEYVYGKPTETIEQTTKTVNEDLTKEDIEKIKEVLDKKY